MRVFRTVPTTNTREILEGNGVATSIATSFVFLQASHLVVTLWNENDEAINSSGVVTNSPLTITTDYTVSGGGDGLEAATGTVNLTFTPTSTQTVTVERILPLVQPTDLPDGTPFRGSTQEYTYDLLCMMIQQLKDAVARALIAPATLDASIDGIVIPRPIDEHILVGRNSSEYELRAIADLVAGSGFSLSSITIYNASGTWEEPAAGWEGFLIVEAVGGGGGGGGCATTAAREAAAAGGGGAGAYAWARIPDVDLASSVTVTVGAGGAAGGAGDNNGVAGGSSSFGSAVVAVGGSGGAGAAASTGGGVTGENGGTGGLASACTGDLVADGGDGKDGITFSDESSGGNQNRRPVQVGDGGPSIYGAIANARIDAGGRAGKKYGGGGAGACNTESQSARAGGAGHSGVVIVYQFGGAV